jgi:hypothetical protein
MYTSTWNVSCSVVVKNNRSLQQQQQLPQQTLRQKKQLEEPCCVGLQQLPSVFAATWYHSNHNYKSNSHRNQAAIMELK